MKYLSLIILVICLISCEDDAVVTEISGIVYDDCSGTPKSYAEVAYLVNAGQSFSEPILIAGDVTDANGYFKFNYELGENENGTANLILVNPNGFNTLVSGLELKKDYYLTLANNNIASLVINLSGTRVFGPNDTLYMGLPTGFEDTYVVQPTSGHIDTLFAAVENSIVAPTSSTLMFGFGLTDFQRSKAAFAADTVYRHRSVNLSGCNQYNVLNLVLN